MKQSYSYHGKYRFDGYHRSGIFCVSIHRATPHAENTTTVEMHQSLWKILRAPIAPHSTSSFLLRILKPSASNQMLARYFFGANIKNGDLNVTRNYSGKHETSRK